MGVPKFFRWISERYPKINQRVAFPPNPETVKKHFDDLPPPREEDDDESSVDGMALCSMPPPIDRLYLDMNGILHGCSHNNSSDEELDLPPVVVSNEEIFTNVCYYLDRIISDMVQPTELVYMAIDGVAPRAKLNQQRSRRYRSGKDGEIERTVYEAHMHTQKQQQQQDATESVYTNSNDDVQEVEPGRFTGKFQTEDSEQQDDQDDVFHPNNITPGTPFFTECTKHLEHFIKHKLSTDPKWQHLTIVFSGPNVPGEGEHKIMEFVRNQKHLDDYNPNLRHCIMGQDGDLIMLGLVTHEPNLVLLREEVIFEMGRKRRLSLSPQNSLQRYIHNHSFEFLHMTVLRDYLAYEFETSNVVPDSPWDVEQVVDDFVFLTFFVGNDFLPHMPALDIADEAFDLLFYTYKKQRSKWLSQKNKITPYLTNAGNIVSGKRLQDFLTKLGEHENVYYDNKKRTAEQFNDKWRQQDIRANRETTIPSNEVIASKEEADRAKFREMLESTVASAKREERFVPVLSNEVKTTFVPEKQELEEGFLSRLGNLLSYSVSSDDKDSEEAAPVIASGIDEDLKGRYYFGKFQFTPYDAEKHIALRKAYIEGLVWCLKYYYEGCVSWEWFYPYHYGPMLSDLVDIDEMLQEISFDEVGEPLRPFEQLMGCLPPSSASLLPEQYRWLLTDESSPICDFYPRSFTVDMNGKRWPWEAVVLLPFIDSTRLISASRTLVNEDMLSEEERERNVVGKPLVFMHDPQHLENVQGIGDGQTFGAIDECRAKSILLEDTVLGRKPRDVAVFRPEICKGVKVAQPGFPSLQEAPIQTLMRKRIGINVFGLRSRYITALLEMADDKPIFPPVSVLGPEFIGTTVFIGYPYLSEGFVTAVSDSTMTMRGKEPARFWNKEERQQWELTSSAVLKRYTHGEKLTGSGGWKIPASDKTFSVRPLQSIDTLPNGSLVKRFARFEVEVPLDAALISPSRNDSRLAGIPARLEKDPYFVAFTNEDTAETEVLVPNSLKNAQASSPDEAPLPQATETINELTHILKNVQASSPDEAPLPQTAESTNELTDILPPRDGGAHMLPPAIDHREVVPRLEPIRMTQGIDSSPILPSPSPELAAAVAQSVSASRVAPRVAVPSISSQSLNQLPLAGGQRKSFSWTNRRSRHAERKYCTAGTRSPLVRTKGSSRGRLLGYGVAATVVFFANCTNGRLASPCPSFVENKSLVSVPTALYCRGGNQKVTDPFGVKHMGSVPPPPLEFAHGTTTISFIFQGGIIAAVDSRASIGNFVGSKTTQKVLPINDYMLGTMAGGAADCSVTIRRLKAEANLHDLTEGRRMSVARASRILSNLLYQYRALDLSVGTMIMGFDEDGGPSIYYVDNTGVRIGGDLFAVGSGSTFALGILDTERRHDMTEDEAISLGIKAIRHATFRDAYSGGFIGVYLITKDGWKKVFSEDLALAGESIPADTAENKQVE